MISSDRTWFKYPGASPQALDALRAAAGVELPDQYYDFLAFSNGGEGPLPVFPFNICLDAAEDATKFKVQGKAEEFFPGFFIFGGDGGGEYIAFDTRLTKPWPVVAIDMTNIQLSESVSPVAADFASFMSLVGIEPDS
ncbi:SMI1/KNR4 family protein [Pseudoduganella aquatica]|uniref:SMI1/KNR4 family protein n=1 Tax=Pseudoduganella aquatica TaxID=2660641 RepID=UPI001E4D612A|nr:SMI1/KNR4 family protein [Pseudoduganella aquatica]